MVESAGASQETQVLVVVLIIQELALLLTEHKEWHARNSVHVTRFRQKNYEELLFLTLLAGCGIQPRYRVVTQPNAQ